MANRPKRPCRFPRCNKLTVAKHGYCREHKKQVDQSYEKQRERPTTIYFTKRWQNLRKIVLNNQPFCADPYGDHKRYGQIGVPATEVDHVDGNPDNNFYERGHPQNNLQGLCKQCHSRKTALEQGRWGKEKVYTAPYSRPYSSR